mgnify:CR=1 FL=1
MKKILTVLCLVIILIIPQLACKAQDQNSPGGNRGVSKSSFHLDTLCSVTIYSMDGAAKRSEEENEKEALLLITDAFKLCDEYEKILSKTVEGSDIYNINNAGGNWVEVRDCTSEVIRKGLKYGEISGGAFDITIGDVTELWDFHGEDEQGKRIGAIPDSEKLFEASKHVDYTKVEIDGNRVRLADSEARLDLGGIAKGYIADRVAEFLEDNGVTSAVVDLGGNIVVIGEKATSMDGGEGTEFSVGVASPTSESGALLGTVSCRDKTVVTSGTYERYFEIDGVKYHHVLNPDTGYPADTDLLSVTIIGDRGTSADCDGLSTTCLAVGKKRAAAIIEETDGVGGIIVDKDGETTVVNVEGFKQF